MLTGPRILSSSPNIWRRREWRFVWFSFFCLRHIRFLAEEVLEFRWFNSGAEASDILHHNRSAGSTQPMSQVWSHTWLVFQPSSRNQPCLRKRRVKSVANRLGLSSSDSVRLETSAIASAEPKILIQTQAFPDVTSSRTGDFDSASEDFDVELDEREKLRRMRISKANKGNTPWNKGRKHSAGIFPLRWLLSNASNKF